MTTQWRKLAAPKEMGGLGIGDLKLKNLGLLLKWWWKYSVDQGSLWKKTVQSVHGIDASRASLNDFQNVTHGPSKEVIRASNEFSWFQEIVNKNFELCLGSGSSVLFWHDAWIGHIPLKDRFQRLFSVSSQRLHLVCDMGTWDGEGWIWNLTWRRDFFQWEFALVQELLELLNANCPKQNRVDRMRWTGGGSEDIYSVKSFNNLVQQHNFEKTLPHEITELIWQKKAPPRAELVVWFLLQEKLKTGSTLLNLNIINSEYATCLFCDAEVESHEHLFFGCHFTWRLWMMCLDWWGISSVLHEDSKRNFISWQSLVSGGFKKELWSSLFFVVVWSIWFERNQACFNGEFLKLESIFTSIKLRLAHWIKFYAPSFPYSSWQVMDNIESVWNWQKKKKKR